MNAIGVSVRAGSDGFRTRSGRPTEACRCETLNRRKYRDGIAQIARSEELRARVRASLECSGYSSLAWVSCDVRGNEVILHGSVPSYHLKQLAQVFAQRVDGVERIQNCLKVSRRLPA
jgi:osmotically-inducible protein OsmY